MSARDGSDPEITVFDPAAEPYASFRIPAIVRSGADLLAFCEGRRDSAADSGVIDIVMRRSEDLGAGWGPLQIVASADGRTVGNPAPIAVPDADTVILLSIQNPAEIAEPDIMTGHGSRRVFVQTSHDRGRTFDRPRDITSAAKDENWGWYATGPGHGIVLADGRLLVPANHSIRPGPGEPVTARLYGGHCLISDDGGATWAIGFTDDSTGDAVNANESTAAQLPDGRVYFNARNQNGTAEGTRIDAYSSDGGRQLDGGYRPQTAIRTPVVQGSVLQAVGGPLLYSGPCHGELRRQLGIHVSNDGGRGWQLATVFEDEPAAYSDLVQIDSRRIGVLFETGAAGPYEAIRFRTFDLEDLAGKPGPADSREIS